MIIRPQRKGRVIHSVIEKEIFPQVTKRVKVILERDANAVIQSIFFAMLDFYIPSIVVAIWK